VERAPLVDIRPGPVSEQERRREGSSRSSTTPAPPELCCTRAADGDLLPRLGGRAAATLPTLPACGSDLPHRSTADVGVGRWGRRWWHRGDGETKLPIFFSCLGLFNWAISGTQFHLSRCIKIIPFFLPHHR
jgi:hypothetical protein